MEKEPYSTCLNCLAEREEDGSCHGCGITEQEDTAWCRALVARENAVHNLLPVAVAAAYECCELSTLKELVDDYVARENDLVAIEQYRAKALEERDGAQ